MKRSILLLSCYYAMHMGTIFANASNLDTSFSNNGSTTNLFIANSINQAQDITSQTDGKIVTVGNASDNAVIVRYNNDGSLDTTFNSSGQKPGTVIVNLGTQTTAYGVTVQPTTHKIIIVGYVNINNIDNAFIACYNKDGSLDGSFNDINGNNSGGYITTIFGGQSQLFKVKVQSNGAIVVAGWATFNGFSNMLVARYTSAGILDTTFNTTGYVTTLIGGIFAKARALYIQIDGKIVVTGQAQVDGNQGLIVARYNANGSLDTTFNNNSSFIAPLSQFTTSTGYGIAMQRDQKIVIVGAINETDAGFANQSCMLLRLNSNGTLDTTFNAVSSSNPDGTPGYVISNNGLEYRGVALQTNSQILTCGFNYTHTYILIVDRYNNDGTVDTSFDFSINESTANNTIGNAIALEINGKIIVTGAITIPFPGQ